MDGFSSSDGPKISSKSEGKLFFFFFLRVPWKWGTIGISQLTTNYSWQVAPAELEAVLLKHPGIQDAAVTGITLKDNITEVPRAFVMRTKKWSNPDQPPLTEKDVYLFARNQLASYKALDGGVIFVEDIPRTASGKIQRFKLSQMNSYRGIVDSLLAEWTAAAARKANMQQGVPAIGVTG